VKFVTSDSGEVLLHYQYSGYGVEAVFGGYPDTMSFAGGTEVGGLVLLGARVYDPETARFISPDPIHHVVNQYAYTLGNPITLWDPGGLQAQPMGGSTVTTRLIQAMATVALGLGLVFTGAAMAVSSLTFGLIGGGLLAIYVGLSVFGPSIEDCGCSVSIGPVPPDGGLEPAAELASSTAIATACSPSSIQATSAPAMPLHLALGLQLLAATMLLRRRRHERS
jgi:RHS repeat-associated protein